MLDIFKGSSQHPSVPRASSRPPSGPQGYSPHHLAHREFTQQPQSAHKGFSLHPLVLSSLSRKERLQQWCWQMEPQLWPTLLAIHSVLLQQQQPWYRPTARVLAPTLLPRAHRHGQAYSGRNLPQMEWRFGKPSFLLSLLMLLVLEWKALCGVHLGHLGLQVPNPSLKSTCLWPLPSLCPWRLYPIKIMISLPLPSLQLPSSLHRPFQL